MKYLHRYPRKCGPDHSFATEMESDVWRQKWLVKHGSLEGGEWGEIQRGVEELLEDTDGQGPLPLWMEQTAPRLIFLGAKEGADVTFPSVWWDPGSGCVFIWKYLRQGTKGCRRWVYPLYDMEAIHKVFHNIWNTFTASHFDIFHWNYFSMGKQIHKEE